MAPGSRNGDRHATEHRTPRWAQTGSPPRARGAAARPGLRSGRDDHREGAPGPRQRSAHLSRPGPALPGPHRRIRQSGAGTQYDPDAQSARPRPGRFARPGPPGRRPDGIASLHSRAGQGPDRNQRSADHLRLGALSRLHPQTGCHRGSPAAGRRRDHPRQDHHGRVCLPLPGIGVWDCAERLRSDPQPEWLLGRQRQRGRGQLRPDWNRRRHRRLGPRSRRGELPGRTQAHPPAGEPIRDASGQPDPGYHGAHRPHRDGCRAAPRRHGGI